MSDQNEFAAVCPELFRPGRFYLTAPTLIPSCGRLPILLPRGGLLYKDFHPGRRWQARELVSLLTTVDLFESVTQLTGRLTTRTNDTAGVITLLGDHHALKVNDVVELVLLHGKAWRYDMCVTAVDGKHVAISGGTGDVLLAEGSPVGVCVDRDSDALLQGHPCRLGPACRASCPLGERIVSIPREADVVYPAGLVWIPRSRYPFAYDWEAVANRFGVRWPLPYLPKQWPPKPKMPVLVGHIGGPSGVVPPPPPARPSPAIIYAFSIETIEYVPDPADDGRRLKSALGRALALKIPLEVVVPDPARRQAGREGARMR